jgi:Polyketide cyclase / dehydrase and lipid transport
VSKRQRIRVTAESIAAPAELYRLLVDGPSWVDWSPLDECVPEGLGPDGREQVGTVRMDRRGRTRGWDRITELDPGRALGYAHLKGLPVRDYAATVTLTPIAGGGAGGGAATLVAWSAEFEPRWPGTGRLLRRSIEQFLGQCARGLAAYVAPPVTNAPAASSSGRSPVEKGHENDLR